MRAFLLTHDADERAILSLALQRAGLTAIAGHDLQRSLRSWTEHAADLIVLDLPGDPLASLRRIRAETTVPVIVITSQLDEESHCRLLENGADLVLARPFSTRLLIAQVRALSRRAAGMPISSLPTMSVAGLTLDPGTRSVKVADQSPRRLTNLEFRLLHTLMIHRDQVLPTETIVEQVWGFSGQGDKELVRGLIRRLRTKVEPDPGQPHYILTVPGLGYSFNQDEP